MKRKESGDIQDCLRKAIEAWPFTAKELARRSGVSESQISYFVSHKRDVTLGTAGKLARVLGLELKRISTKQKR